ncbi:MAG: tetratricopeptide repeat protein [Terriglobia bacterium]|nr:tetratricopeptide repeat protein [Terriglobia bacterium]
MEYFKLAYDKQAEGEYREAIELYTKSIEAFPSAEPYTFRGWAYSYLEDYEQAIEDCKRAIEIDPEFGNPYNDIGAYLIELDKPDEAIVWLEKAIGAKRYEARCYPYYNLGRVYEARHEWKRARECYQKALAENGEYLAPARALKRLSAMFN